MYIQWHEMQSRCREPSPPPSPELTLSSRTYTLHPLSAPSPPPSPHHRSLCVCELACFRCGVCPSVWLVSSSPSMSQQVSARPPFPDGTVFKCADGLHFVFPRPRTHGWRLPLAALGMLCGIRTHPALITLGVDPGEEQLGHLVIP